MSKRNFLFEKDGFKDWESLNDTIMGGKSVATCESTNSGLIFKGNIIEKGGGFVSCRSSLYKPPLDLSKFNEFEINVAGEGRNFKFAVSCQDEIFGLTEFIPGGLKWIKSFQTNKFGNTTVRLSFKDLRPSIRANKVNFPFKFNASKIKRLQILHSRFGDEGSINKNFKPGSIKILLKSISVF
tara:strand:+ start:1015 stop:1563 length:549 start_codon:yes stop_codon:yes gene_type:complete